MWLVRGEGWQNDFSLRWGFLWFAPMAHGTAYWRWSQYVWWPFASFTGGTWFTLNGWKLLKRRVCAYLWLPWSEGFEVLALDLILMRQIAPRASISTDHVAKPAKMHPPLTRGGWKTIAIIHAKMCTIADFYGIPDLRRIACEKFTFALDLSTIDQPCLRSAQTCFMSRIREPVAFKPSQQNIVKFTRLPWGPKDVTLKGCWSHEWYRRCSSLLLRADS